MVDKTVRYTGRSRVHRMLRFMFRAEIGRLKKENRILDEQKNIAPFIECTYKKQKEFSTISCGEDDDSFAFISRFHESASTNFRCVDRMDVLPCLSNDDISKFNSTKLKSFPQCAGVNNIRLKNTITQASSIVAPSIDIKEHQGRILRPKDFLVQCPKCAINSFFGWRDIGDIKRLCAREIKTYSRGWPQHARFCDEEDIHDEQDFCRLHDLLLEKLGGEMEESNELKFVDSNR
ncbi:unnamed protein product [Cercopithifilaria johnstoni]|uniref:Uncharacterized protein n=1 Tax=Cercopithifilaria johnstoni TaxID=2874296 RepID=A0A8J2PPU8_9BILA|nr:unnamed protein product [Cercopithifilaria johnstoni]